MSCIDLKEETFYWRLSSAVTTSRYTHMYGLPYRRFNNFFHDRCVYTNRRQLLRRFWLFKLVGSTD